MDGTMLRIQAIDSSEMTDRFSTKETFRSQQSLGLITQRFMNLRQKNEVMNLNQIVKELCIPKRRVYDVVNVLEGLGYIQKVEKNNIKWIGGENKNDCQDLLEAAVEKLRQQEKILEFMLNDADSTLKLHIEDPISRPYNYVHKTHLQRTLPANSKSIIVKSDVDVSSSFDLTVQLADLSAIHGTNEVIVRNKNGVKSHALLFSPQITAGPIDDKEDVNNEQRIENMDSEGLETFIIPTSTISSASQNGPETPGRGLLISPFKSLIDPTCILSSFCEDNGYIQISTPSESQDKQRPQSSVLELFHD